LNFTWESLDSAAQSLDKIRTISFDHGEPSHADSEWVDRFISEVNDDLNMPRAVAVLWELIKSDLPARVKKATLLFYDRILGLGLQDYHPNEEIIPEEVMMLAKQRQAARMEKNWALGDTLRIQINQKGYEIEDTAQGPKIRKKKEVQNK
jgi:cysteinyl-tRNA synthetase